MAAHPYSFYCSRCGYKTLFVQGRHSSGERGFVCMNQCGEFKPYQSRKRVAQSKPFNNNPAPEAWRMTEKEYISWAAENAKTHGRPASIETIRSRIPIWKHQYKEIIKRRKSSELQRGARLLADFTGKKPRRLIERTIAAPPDVGLVFGELIQVGYRSRRDGALYRHTFRSKKSRPLLIASSDGKQLYIVGGRYRFTDRGIEDV